MYTICTYPNLYDVAYFYYRKYEEIAVLMIKHSLSVNLKRNKSCTKQLDKIRELL